MRPVTDAFTRTVASSHKMVARATVCNTFQTTTTPVGQRINILGGEVKIDGTAEIRSTLNLLTDERWPRIAADLLAPYGNEIYVEAGVSYGDFAVEYVGLGYFRIDEPEQDKPRGPVQLTAVDRMAGIIDARLIKPRRFAAGTMLGTIVNTLVFQVYPAAVIEWDDSTDTLTLARAVIATEDRFAFIDELIRSRGKVWYWDHRGALVIKSLPSSTAPVATIAAGAGGVLVGLSRKLSRRGVYNAVVATGEAADTAKPARGVAVDSNPNSPTYYFGRFGPVPRFFTSPFLETNVQAFSAADAMLRRNLGLPYSVDFRTLPNPALEPWDPVKVRPDSNEGAETHVLETLTVPLTQDDNMAATTREQTLVLVGSA